MAYADNKTISYYHDLFVSLELRRWMYDIYSDFIPAEWNRNRDDKLDEITLQLQEEIDPYGHARASGSDSKDDVDYVEKDEGGRS